LTAFRQTGAGTTASRVGQPDLGLSRLADMRANAEMIVSLDVTNPLIADIDTDFGGLMTTKRAVTEYTCPGVASSHIDDQVFQKRCGHLNGK
jgi:methylisocitrate lyase